MKYCVKHCNRDWPCKNSHWQYKYRVHEKKGPHRSLDAPCTIGNYLIDKLYCLIINSGPGDWGSLTILPQPPSLKGVCMYAYLYSYIYARECLYYLQAGNLKCITTSVFDVIGTVYRAILYCQACIYEFSSKIVKVPILVSKWCGKIVDRILRVTWY